MSAISHTYCRFGRLFFLARFLLACSWQGRPGKGDIRKIGSGNIGATNVLRTGRKDIAALTLLLDAAKAGVTGLVIAHLFGQPYGYIAAAAALVGHCYPVWLGFKGGKGVATFFGGLFALVWPVGVFAAIVWLATAFITRLSSLGALLACIFSSILAWLISPAAAALMVSFYGRHYPDTSPRKYLPSFERTGEQNRTKKLVFMQLRELSFAERRDWLRLTRTHTVGPVAFRDLLKRFGTAAKALGRPA